MLWDALAALALPSRSTMFIKTWNQELGAKCSHWVVSSRTRRITHGDHFMISLRLGQKISLNRIIELVKVPQSLDSAAFEIDDHLG